MLIAKLRISLRDAHIAFNSPKELGIDARRGSVLGDGKVVRGLGTHFASVADKERYDRLTKESNKIRDQFNRQFMRTPIDGTFIIATKGQGKLFIESIEKSNELDVSVVEFELSNGGDSLDEEEMDSWSQRVKNQLTRIPLGRGEDVDKAGLAALETLAQCPVLSADTATEIKSMIFKVREGTMRRDEFKKSLEGLHVGMDQAALAQ